MPKGLGSLEQKTIDRPRQNIADYFTFSHYSSFSQNPGSLLYISEPVSLVRPISYLSRNDYRYLAYSSANYRAQNATKYSLYETGKYPVAFYQPAGSLYDSGSHSKETERYSWIPINLSRINSLYESKPKTYAASRFVQKTSYKTSAYKIFANKSSILNQEAASNYQAGSYIKRDYTRIETSFDFQGNKITKLSSYNERQIFKLQSKIIGVGHLDATGYDHKNQNPTPNFSNDGNQPFSKDKLEQIVSSIPYSYPLVDIQIELPLQQPMRQKSGSNIEIRLKAIQNTVQKPKLQDQPVYHNPSNKYYQKFLKANLEFPIGNMQRTINFPEPLIYKTIISEASGQNKPTEYRQDKRVPKLVPNQQTQTASQQFYLGSYSPKNILKLSQARSPEKYGFEVQKQNNKKARYLDTHKNNSYSLNRQKNPSVYSLSKPTRATIAYSLEQKAAIYKPRKSDKSEEKMKYKSSSPEKPGYRQKQIQNPPSQAHCAGNQSERRSEESSNYTGTIAQAAALSLGAAGLAIGSLFSKNELNELSEEYKKDQVENYTATEPPAISRKTSVKEPTKAKDLEKKDLGQQNTYDSASILTPISPQQPKSDEDGLDSIILETEAQPSLSAKQIFGDNIVARFNSWHEATNSLGFETVSFSIYDAKTGKYYGQNDKMELPAPSLNKVGILFGLYRLAQKGIIDLDKGINYDPNDESLVLTRELGHYPIFSKQRIFKEEDVSALAIKESVNTATNILISIAGDGNFDLGKKRLNSELEELGYGDMKIRASYITNSEYTSNTTTTEVCAKLMNDINQGINLSEDYNSKLKQYLENEKPLMGHRSLIPDSKSGTKATIWKLGTGFEGYFGDRYSASVIFHNSPEELFPDATDKMHIRTRPGSRLSNTINASAEFFKLIGEYLLNQNVGRKEINQLQ